MQGMSVPLGLYHREGEEGGLALARLGEGFGACLVRRACRVGSCKWAAMRALPSHTYLRADKGELQGHEEGYKHQQPTAAARHWAAPHRASGDARAPGQESSSYYF